MWTEQAYEYKSGLSSALVGDPSGDGEIASASGSFLHTFSGRQLLDFSSGVLTYQHPVLVEELKKGLRQMSLSGRMFFSAPLAALVNRLSTVVAGGRAVVYPCNSPAEAMEGALKLALGFHKRRRNKIIGIRDSCQGNTLGTLSISGISDMTDHFDWLPLNTVSVNFGQQMEMIEAIDDTVAAVVIEPILLSGTLQLLPEGYLKEVRNACLRHGALLIVNESFTGFGRLGHWFSWQAEDAVPDIMVTGNVLGGNIVPYGAYIAKSHINNAVYKRKDPALHGATTAGFPMGCVIACKVLDLLEADRLSGSPVHRERLLSQGLTKIQTRFPEIIREVMVKGLAGGIRFYEAGMANSFIHHAARGGILLHNCDARTAGSEWLAIFPPLLAAEKEITEGMALLNQCLSTLR